MTKTKKLLYLFYVALALVLGLLEVNHMIQIRNQVVWFLGIVFAVKLFTTIPFPQHELSTIRATERLSKEQRKYPTMNFLDFLLIIIPPILFLDLLK